MGCSISSNNHIGKGKPLGNWTPSQLRQPLEFMQSGNRKVKRKEYMSERVINMQHVTLNDTAQPVKLCMAITTKGNLVQKGHNLMNCNRLPL